ncbi:hypothetical protein CsatB_016702 [Cannabis sativa]
MRKYIRMNSSNNSKSYEYLQKAHNHHNKVEKQFEIENDTERRPFSILSYKSETRAPTHAPLDHHHRYIEKNKSIDHQFETQSLTPSSLSQQECHLKKTTLAVKSVCANSSFPATKFEIKEESKKRKHEVFEKARIEKEIEERENREKGEKLQRQKERLEKEEREKRTNLQRLIREREAHLAMIEKVKQEVDHSDQNHKYFLELEKLCGYKQSCQYDGRNSKMHNYSSSNILFGTPLKKLGLFLKNDEEKEFEEEEENLNLQN